VGTGVETSGRQVAEEVLDITGKPRTLIQYVADRPGHDYRYALDMARITELGWAPKVSFSDGLRRTVDWYRANEAWWRPLKTGEYWEFYKQNYRPLVR
jgi:dTDP-glucose 4,6-dehydratase